MSHRALLLVSIFAIGGERPSDPAETTNTFFADLAEGRLDAAFDGTAFFFQHQQTRKEFEATVHELGLVGGALTKADAPAMHGATVKQPVEIRRSDGGRLRLIVTLARDRGAWRVFSLRSPVKIETGVSWNFFTHIGRGMDLVSVQENPVPTEPDARRMAKETMLQFHDAIQQKSFEDFYEGVARSWQRELTLGMLTRTFQGFIDQRTNLIAMKDLEAVLTQPPRIDSEGLLVIAGIYPTQPYRIEFELKYFYELPNWRPFGVGVRMLN